MNFDFSEKEKQLRSDIREFVRKELPSDWAGGGYAEEYGDEYGWELAQMMAKKLAAKGWLTMSWPREYGGLAASHMENFVYRDEMAYHMVPGTDMGVGGVTWIGPSLIMFGSEEQKKKHLPGISKGEVFWCTGYSEPDTGSDLASLKMRAVRKGNEYILNGQKVWTSAGHRSSWCWMAVRTDPDAPKHKGISLLLVDLKLPGVTVNPLVNMAGYPGFSEVFMDDVHVPADCLIGEENQGWRYIMTALDFERTAGIEFLAKARRVVYDLVDYAKVTKRNGRLLCEDPLVRHKLADLAIAAEVGTLLCYRIGWMEEIGQIPNYESSACKNLGAELAQKIAATGMQIAGLYGQLEGGPRSPLRGLIEVLYLSTIGDTLGGGTSEVNRSVIAMRGLGLPRG